MLSITPPLWIGRLDPRGQKSLPYTLNAWPQRTSLSWGLKYEQRTYEPAVVVFFDAGGISGQAVHVGQVGVGGEAREHAGADVEVTEAASGYGRRRAALTRLCTSFRPVGVTDGRRRSSAFTPGFRPLAV